jgi:hypothetical protein
VTPHDRGATGRRDHARPGQGRSSATYPAAAFCGAVSTDILHLPARVVVPTDHLGSANVPHGFEELSGVSERPMIIRMARLQQRYDHRLRDLVQRTGDVTIATDLGIPRSTARGWLDKAPKVVVGLDVTA